MAKEKIIIKASDYRYPTRTELLAVYEHAADLPHFGYNAKGVAASLFESKLSLKEIHRNDHLAYWDHVLLNRNGAITHSYHLSAANYSRGVPDELKNFLKDQYINRMQFDYYAEIFYYHFSTVKDTLAHILNIYFSIGKPIHQIYLNDDLIQRLPNNEVAGFCRTFLQHTSLATSYRNSFTHRTPINIPDTRSTLEMVENKLVYGSSSQDEIPSSKIMENMVNTLSATGEFIHQLKLVMLQ